MEKKSFINLRVAAYLDQPSIKQNLYQEHNIEYSTQNMTNTSLMVRKEVTGLGKATLGTEDLNQLMLEDDKKAIGVRDFHERKIEPGVVAVITGIRVSWAMDATETDPRKLKFSPIADDGANVILPVLYDGIIRIRQRDLLLLDMPVKEAMYDGGPSQQPNGDSYFVLDNLFHLVPKYSVSMELILGDAVLDGTNKWHLEVALQATKTIKK